MTPAEIRAALVTMLADIETHFETDERDHQYFLESLEVRLHGLVTSLDGTADGGVVNIAAVQGGTSVLQLGDVHGDLVL